MKRITATIAGSLIALAATVSASFADKLTYYCSAQEDWCQLMARSFEDATGIDVNMTRKSSGETFAQIRAESSNPKGDVWWGGTGDPHLQAAEEGLTMEYMSPMRDQLHDWAIAQAESAGNKHHRHLFRRAGLRLQHRPAWPSNNLPEPSCWKDLLKPEYKGHVQMANPNSSGTAYTTLASMVQIFGEDDGFEFMKGLHTPTSTSTPSRARRRSRRQVAARTPSASSSCTMRSSRPCPGFPIKVVRTVRRHRIRDRLDVDHRRRAQPGRGKDVL